MGEEMSGDHRTTEEILNEQKRQENEHRDNLLKAKLRAEIARDPREQASLEEAERDDNR